MSENIYSSTLSPQGTDSISRAASQVASPLSPIFKFVQTSVVPPVFFTLALLIIILNVIVCCMWQQNLSLRTKVSIKEEAILLLLGKSYVKFCTH